MVHSFSSLLGFLGLIDFLSYYCTVLCNILFWRMWSQWILSTCTFYYLLAGWYSLVICVSVVVFLTTCVMSVECCYLPSVLLPAGRHRNCPVPILRKPNMSARREHFARKGGKASVWLTARLLSACVFWHKIEKLTLTQFLLISLSHEIELYCINIPLNL